MMLCVVHPPPPDTAKPITWTTNYRFSSNTIACSARRCTRQYIEQVGASQLPLFGCVGWWRVHHTTLELYLRDLDPTVTCDSRHCAGRDSRRVFNTSHVSSTWPNGATEFVGLPPDGDVEDGAMTQQIRASTHPRIDQSVMSLESPGAVRSGFLRATWPTPEAPTTHRLGWNGTGRDSWIESRLGIVSVFHPRYTHRLVMLLLFVANCTIRQ